jgi:hypothetical protein
MFVALAAQKRHLALYLTNVAFVQGGEEAFKAKYLETGKKLDLGDRVFDSGPRTTWR